jgi:dCMP deaminase
MSKILLAYVPVLHRGYIDFLERHSDALMVCIFGTEVIQDFDWLHRKEIRAVDPEVMRKVISTLYPKLKVLTLDHALVEKLKKTRAKFIFANEEESRQVALKLFSGCEVLFDEVFLRWDRTSLYKKEEVDLFPIATEAVHRLFMEEAELESTYSSDWWRRVGGVLLASGRKFVAYNKHVPSDHTPWSLGDPRNLLNRGIGIEMTSVLHVEAGLIARAALEGISTKGAVLYVTTFPCPFCANVLAYSGISELYFRDGYSVLNGAKLLQDQGISIFKVL